MKLDERLFNIADELACSELYKDFDRVSFSIDFNEIIHEVQVSFSKDDNNYIDIIRLELRHPLYSPCILFGRWDCELQDYSHSFPKQIKALKELLDKDTSCKIFDLGEYEKAFDDEIEGFEKWEQRNY